MYALRPGFSTCQCSSKAVPQFILDSLILSNRGSKASILITQPRRLSAIGVATRVSAERMEDGSVGYAIRGESRQTPKTKLLFCTTGIVLRRLSLGDRLEDVTHVVVDEVRASIKLSTALIDSVRFTKDPSMEIFCFSNSRSSSKSIPVSRLF